MTSINKSLTDEERVELTKKAYENLRLGQEVKLGVKTIGKVAQAVRAQDGMWAYAIAGAGEITILYKGSFGIIKGNPDTWRKEWLKTNFPVLVAMLARERIIPSQLKTARKFLNKIIKEYHRLPIYIYGHSLGSINAQYALAGCSLPKRIGGAYLYEGTNIWPILNRKERRTVSLMREKIYNYVDIYDPVTLGLTATHRMVGRLMYVDSRKMATVKQHMWGGYRFDDRGRLKLRKIDSEFLREVKNQRQLLSVSKGVASNLEELDRAGSLKNFLLVKLLRGMKKKDLPTSFDQLIQQFLVEREKRR